MTTTRIRLTEFTGSGVKRELFHNSSGTRIVTEDATGMIKVATYDSHGSFNGERVIHPGRGRKIEGPKL